MDVDLGEMVTDSRLIGMQISARGSRALSREGLTAIQARVLLYILVRSKRGTSLTEIHRETGYSMAATSGLIKRLREKDYVLWRPASWMSGASCSSPPKRESASRRASTPQ